MENRVEKQQDKFFDDLLESIKPNSKEIIERRIHHIMFAKIIAWLCLESRNKFIFEKQKLRKFIGLTNSRIQEIINDLIGAGLIKKNTKSTGKIYYSFIKDESSGRLFIREYFEEALKTLGKKPKREVTFKLEEEMSEESYF